jgi:hypothetical protein
LVGDDFAWAAAAAASAAGAVAVGVAWVWPGAAVLSPLVGVADDSCEELEEPLGAACVGAAASAVAGATDAC